MFRNNLDTILGEVNIDMGDLPKEETLFPQHSLSTKKETVSVEVDVRKSGEKYSLYDFLNKVREGTLVLRSTEDEGEEFLQFKLLSSIHKIEKWQFIFGARFPKRAHTEETLIFGGTFVRSNINPLYNLKIKTPSYSLGRPSEERVREVFDLFTFQEEEL